VLCERTEDAMVFHWFLKRVILSGVKEFACESLRGVERPRACLRCQPPYRGVLTMNTAGRAARRGLLFRPLLGVSAALPAPRYVLIRIRPRLQPRRNSHKIGPPLQALRHAQNERRVKTQNESPHPSPARACPVLPKPRAKPRGKSKGAACESPGRKSGVSRKNRNQVPSSLP
jgi:hypothetical protein